LVNTMTMDWTVGVVGGGKTLVPAGIPSIPGLARISVSSSLLPLVNAPAGHLARGGHPRAPTEALAQCPGDGGAERGRVKGGRPDSALHNYPSACFRSAVCRTAASSWSSEKT
jgi:hypothetical protein